MANNQNLTPPVKGEVRNPWGVKGKDGTKGMHLSTRIRDMLTDENFEQKLKDGTVLKGEPLQAILKVAIAKARSGDNFAMEWLAKYGWGQKLTIGPDEDMFSQEKMEVKVVENVVLDIEQKAITSEGTA